MKQHQIYLSRRNLLALLSKLDRLENGDETACAIIKYANPSDPYCNTIDQVVVTVVADEKFYTNRQPGAMHPLDEVRL
jgi:hypothetical protein